MIKPFVLRDDLPGRQRGPAVRHHSDNFPFALILNLVLFQYFTEATSRAVRAISARESMVRKMQFPRIVIPLTINMSATINMYFNLIGISCSS